MMVAMTEQKMKTFNTAGSDDESFKDVFFVVVFGGVVNIRVATGKMGTSTCNGIENLLYTTQAHWKCSTHTPFIGTQLI